MQVLQTKSEPPASDRPDRRTPSSESLSVRNYDAATVNTLSVRLVDSRDEVVVDRSVSVEPSETASVRLPVDRATYRVEATLDEDASDSAECLVGDTPEERAVVECGNGVVTVTAGRHTR
ncbi:hypothetical protein ACFQMF_03060 [Halorubrum rutilum]|uniref:Ig-like domain-containing protein n=1 Tax=Halorubrum rutilum TaxID=1364933 RepID=A0ABD6AH01_9EURY|nr:hypothetical protein [Halorubrum rutilum]